MDFVPSEEQQEAIEKIKTWFFDKKRERDFFVLVGVAGSGKSSILHLIPSLLNLSVDDIRTVAYTGRACHILINKGIDAYTLHKLMYIPHEIIDPEDNTKTKIVFTKREELDSSIRLIICDEASFLDENITEDLLSFGIPVLFVGDHRQLPPINGVCGIFTAPDSQLDTIHRQAEHNPILKISKMVREGQRVMFGTVGGAFMKTAIDKLNENQLLRADQILCGKNNTRRKLINKIRKMKGIEQEHPIIGDRIICLKNNWDIGLVNGQQGIIIGIGEINTTLNSIIIDFEDEFGMKFNGLKCYLSDFLGQDRPQNQQSAFNKTIQSFDFAYAITVHKFQGSQADKVIFYEENFMRDDDLHQRWLYTAVTRAAKALIWVS
jgi:exodeoxyribonuclease-5